MFHRFGSLHDSPPPTESACVIMYIICIMFIYKHIGPILAKRPGPYGIRSLCSKCFFLISQLSLHSAHSGKTKGEKTGPGGCFNKYAGRPTWRRTILQWTNNMGGWSVARSDSSSCLQKQAPDLKFLTQFFLFFFF